jgi:RNA polymerase sigma-70 factor (ECF subfamily)
MIQDIMGFSRTEQQWTTYADEEILRALKKDPEALGVLIDRYEAAFLRKARSILYSPEEAEEAVQDVFTRIYVYADRYETKEGASFSSWAYAILTRLCFTRYQKLKKQRGRMMALEPETYERLRDESDFVEELALKDEVVIALSRLPEMAAKALALQFLEGKTQEEIAVAEGASVSAVKTRVHRAKKLFKKSLSDTSYGTRE